MEKKDEPWSKRVWYLEGLILLLMIFTGVYTNIVVMLTLVILSLIVIGIISIYLKITESPDIKPELIPSNSISQQFQNNRIGTSHNENQYSSLRNNLNIPTSSSSSSIQQIGPITSNYSSTIQVEDKSQAKYITSEGVQYRIRSKSLKLRNKLINNITDIQGLDKIWRLRRLDLSHNQIVSMKGIEFLPNLRKLKLSDNKIQKIENIKNFHRLKKLTINNNQLKVLNSGDLPNSLKHINVAKNPIEKFNIYTKATYEIIHFGPKKWFPNQEINSLKKLMRSRTTYRSYEVSEGLTKFLVIFTIWAILTFLLALLVNLAFWGVMHSNSILTIDFWQCLFNQGSWSFVVGAIGAIFLMIFFYVEING